MTENSHCAVCDTELSQDYGPVAAVCSTQCKEYVSLAIEYHTFIPDDAKKRIATRLEQIRRERYYA